MGFHVKEKGLIFSMGFRAKFLYSVHPETPDETLYTYLRRGKVRQDLSGMEKSKVRR